MKIADTLIKIIESDLRSGNTVFLAGEPGIGKTSIVKTLANNASSQCFIVQVNQLADKADLTGARLVPTPDNKSFEQKFFAHHKVREAVAYANANPKSPVYLLLDEINRSTPDVTSGALSISTERELGNQKLPKNIRIIVTGNTKGNVVALDDASLSRFVIYDVEPDAPTLVAYLDSRNSGARPLNPFVKAVLTKNPDSVFEKSAPTSYSVVDGGDDDDDQQMATFADLTDASEEMLQLTTPRTIESISNWLDDIQANDSKFLQELFQTAINIGDRDVTMLHAVIEGHVGNTTFSKLLIGEIANSFSVANTATATGPTISKPDFWNELLNQTTRTDLDRYIEDLSENERIAAVLYAISSNVPDHQNNTTISSALMIQIDDFNPDASKKFTTMLSGQNYNSDNLTAILSVNTDSAKKLKNVASILGVEV